MGIFDALNKLVKAGAQTAMLPLDVARDILLAVPTGEVKTKDRLESIVETLEEGIEEIDK